MEDRDSRIPVEIHTAGSEEWNSPLRMLVAGYPGVRKTAFAARFTNPIFALSGGTLPELARCGTPYVQINTESDLYNLAQFLQESYYETLVIDTIDGLQNVLLDDRLRDQHRNELKIDDWKWLEQRLRAIFAGLSDLPQHLIITSNIRDINVDGETHFLPAIQGGFSNQIHQFLTHSLWLRGNVPPPEVDENAEDFYLVTQPRSNAEWVGDYTHTLPKILPVNFESDEGQILAARNDALIGESFSVEVIWGKEAVEHVLAERDDAESDVSPDTTPDISETETEADAETTAQCSVCGKDTEEPWIELSKLRFGAIHCVDCFKAAN